MFASGRNLSLMGKVLSALTVLCCLLVLLCSVRTFKSSYDLEIAQVQQYESYLLADELRHSSDDLTRLARTYVVTANPAYAEQFYDVLAIRNGEKERPQNYNRVHWDFVSAGLPTKQSTGQKVSLKDLMIKAGFTKEEFALLALAQSNSDALVDIENKAMNAVKGKFQDSKGGYTIIGEPDLKLASDLMHSEEYHLFKGRIMEPIDQFIGVLENRYALKVSYLKQQKKMSFLILLGCVTILCALAFIQFIVMNKKILNPIAAIAKTLDALSRKEHTGDIPFLDHNNEIGSMAQSAMRFKCAAEADMETIKIASSAKSEFLANMSHEIRTPMNGVLGMAQILQRIKLDDKQTQLVTTIKTSGDALLTIINDILDYSKIEAGKVDLDPVPFNLVDTVEDVAALVAVNAHKKGLKLIVCIAPHVNYNVVGDVGRIRQVLTNLIGNAIKFTSAGHVLINLDGALKGDSLCVKLQVSDTGIGLKPDQVKAIFEKFSQADSSTTRKFGGTGLGLSITKSYIDLMKGNISVSSEFGQGSQFLVTLDLPVSSEEEEVGELKIGPSNTPVMIVDDCMLTRDILTSYLGAMGVETLSVKGVREALKALLHARNSGGVLPLILTNYAMPEHSGVDLLRAIRKTEAISDTDVIVMSSILSDEAMDEIKQFSPSDVLTKPIRFKVLKSVVSDALAGRAKHQSVTNNFDAKASMAINSTAA